MSSLNVGKHLHEANVGVEIGALTMRYEDGGKVEVWSDGNRSVRVRGGAGPGEIAEAFKETGARPFGCILCANGNDLPDGEYCRGCGREATS